VDDSEISGNAAVRIKRKKGLIGPDAFFGRLTSRFAKNRLKAIEVVKRSDFNKNKG